MAEINNKQPQQDITERLSNEIVTQTNLTNLTAKLLRIVDYHFWDGHTKTDFPDLPSNSSATPLQAGANPPGVKFGLKYAEDVHPSARMFVVAFDFPAQKVYADSRAIGLVDWNDVEQKLRNCESKVIYVDPVLKGKVEAQMDSVETAHAIFSG